MLENAKKWIADHPFVAVGASAAAGAAVMYVVLYFMGKIKK